MSKPFYITFFVQKFWGRYYFQCYLSYIIQNLNCCFLYSFYRAVFFFGGHDHESILKINFLNKNILIQNLEELKMQIYFIIYLLYTNTYKHYKHVINSKLINCIIKRVKGGFRLFLRAEGQW